MFDTLSSIGTSESYSGWFSHIDSRCLTLMSTGMSESYGGRFSNLIGRCLALCHRLGCQKVIVAGLAILSTGV